MTADLFTPKSQTPVKMMMNEAVVSQKDLDTVKYQLSEQRMANEELISERRGLMDLIESLESQSKDSHRNMEKALDKVAGLEKITNQKD